MVEFDGFTCIICKREWSSRFAYKWSDYPVPPVCDCCRETYGPKSMPSAGSFRDRKVVQTIGALAEALHTEAALKNWSEERGHRYARS